MNNNHSEKMELMNRIQKLAFAKTESELFLDTHPECRQALEYFKEVVKNLEAAVEEYAAKYGPITSSDVEGDGWTWAESAWPWHVGKEK